MTGTADFLLELRSEEIPARMQSAARNTLARLLAEELGKEGIEAKAIETWSTPRRLALIARDLPLATEKSSEEIKGPRTSAPPQALEGFLRKTGLSKEQLEEREGIWFARIENEARPTGDLLAAAIERIVRDFPWPKSMRWGSASTDSGSLRWVRPLHGIVAMLGEEIVRVQVDGIDAGATTLGHRFHHPGPITIGGASDYAEKLRACHVIVDQDEREAIVREGASKAATDAGLVLVEDEGLVVENAGLTEWPTPMLGRFDPDYLDVPGEVIVLTMRTNQKYFACRNDDGGLAAAFVCVANIEATDGGSKIVDGNGRVLAARLADARFFWEQDLKIPLEQQATRLGGIVFHEKLGTIADKVDRVARLARWLAEQKIVDADPDQTERAARLAKADLVSGMVGEFPELQGVIGGYLAARQGEDGAIADAVRDHYRPVGQSDEVPTAPVTVAVALADRLDTLAGFFIVDEKPTGSKDPYALRRAALSVISLILANRLRLHLTPLLFRAAGSALANATGIAHSEKAQAIADALEKADIADRRSSLADYERHVFEPQLRASASLSFDRIKSAVAELLAFLADRLKVQQREAGVRHDLIDAVFALGGEDDLVRLLARVSALQGFVETAEGADLLSATKRASNILRKEGWDAAQVMSSGREQGIPQTGEEDPLVLVEEPAIAEAVAEMAQGTSSGDLQPQEETFLDALDRADAQARSAVEAEDFAAAMAALSQLRGPIDDFFDAVTVNDADAAKRERRLNMLLRFREAVHLVADFSRIES